MVQASGLKELLVRPLILLFLERPPNLKRPSGFPFCVLGLKIDFAGLPGFLTHLCVPEERQEVCRQLEELPHLPCEVSMFRIRDWEAQDKGKPRDWPLGSEAKQEQSEKLPCPRIRLYRQAFGSFEFFFFFF